MGSLRPFFGRIGAGYAHLRRPLLQQRAVSSKPRVALLYGSFGRDRDSEHDARALRQGWDSLKLAERFPSASVSEPLEADAFDFNALADVDFLLVVTSSRFGYPPPNCTAFSHNLYLAAKSNPGCLSHLQHAVFGNGHAKWFDTYMSMPRYVDRLLEEAGSRRFFARGENREPHTLKWPSGHPGAQVDMSTHAVSVDDWALPMWTTLAAVADGLEAPPERWGALWDKQASSKHHEVCALADLYSASVVLTARRALTPAHPTDPAGD